MQTAAEIKLIASHAYFRGAVEQTTGSASKKNFNEWYESIAAQFSASPTEGIDWEAIFDNAQTMHLQEFISYYKSGLSASPQEGVNLTIEQYQEIECGLGSAVAIIDECKPVAPEGHPDPFAIHDCINNVHHAYNAIKAAAPPINTDKK